MISMKVAIIMPLATLRGGAELMLLHLLEHGRDESIVWRVIFLEEGPMVAQVQALGVTTEVIPAGQLRQGVRFAATVRRISASVRTGGMDVLLGWMPKAHLYGSPAALLAGIPTVWYHVGIFSSGNWLDEITARLPARGVITLCRSCRADQQRVSPRRPVRLVYPGVDTARFNPEILPSPSEARQRLGLSPEGPLIGLVGRLQRWKGIHVLIEAAAQVLQTHPQAHFVVVGGKHDLEPDYPQALQDRITALSLHDNVLLAGFQADVPLWMQAMDVIVHASDNEPFGIVVIEAMALGKPIVAGSAGGPVDIVTEGVNGLLTPYGDAPALAGALLQLLDEPAVACRLGEAARVRALEFSAQHYAHNVMAAVRALLESPPALESTPAVAEMQA